MTIRPLLYDTRMQYDTKSHPAFNTASQLELLVSVNLTFDFRVLLYNVS
jgi:hypothetical protein